MLSEKLLNDFNSLPKDKQEEVIDFVEFLKRQNEKELESIMDNIIKENEVALKELGK